MAKIRAAVIQMVSHADPAENWTTARTLLDQAVQQNAKLLLLPENFLSFGVTDQSLVAQQWVDHDGPIIQMISEFSRQHQCWVVAGTLPASTADHSTRVYSRSLVLGPDGQILGHYDKTHLFDVYVAQEDTRYGESETFVSGDQLRALSINNQGLDVGMILSVCYDLRFPELYRKIMHPEIRILNVPSAFTYATGRDHWEILLRARAIENQCFVLAANQGGEHYNKRKTWGHSMIISPWGEVLGSLTLGEGVLVCELDFDDQDRIREAMPCLEHRRFE